MNEQQEPQFQHHITAAVSIVGTQKGQRGHPRREPVSDSPARSRPCCAARVELADAHGVTVVSLADELAWKPARIRQMLGVNDERPPLRLLEKPDLLLRNGLPQQGNRASGTCTIEADRATPW